MGFSWAMNSVASWKDHEPQHHENRESSANANANANTTYIRASGNENSNLPYGYVQDELRALA